MVVLKSSSSLLSRRILPVLIALSCLTSCEEAYSPKPAGYPRVAYPQRENYGTFTECTHSIHLPDYVKLTKEAGRGSEGATCFYNLNFTGLNATLHISYLDITSPQKFEEMLDDAHTFAYKHSVKAEDIIVKYKQLSPDKHSVTYSIQGNTASPYQFLVTDSVQHYVRGALYFNSKPNKDSTQPILEYVLTDIDSMLSTLVWE